MDFSEEQKMPIHRNLLRWSSLSLELNQENGQSRTKTTVAR